MSFVPTNVGNNMVWLLKHFSFSVSCKTAKLVGPIGLQVILTYIQVNIYKLIHFKNVSEGRTYQYLNRPSCCLVDFLFVVKTLFCEIVKMKL